MESKKIIIIIVKKTRIKCSLSNANSMDTHTNAPMKECLTQVKMVGIIAKQQKNENFSIIRLSKKLTKNILKH